MAMNSDQLYESGRLSSSSSWTDRQLTNICKSIQQVLPYLEGRGDCGIVCATMKAEYNKFMDMKELRKRPAAQQLSVVDERETMVG